MKQKILAMAAIAAVTALTSTSRANLYTDTTGDIMPSNTILDITSVDVTNTASEIVFKIKLAGNPVTTDWGKYCIGIDTNPATGDIGANGNGWGRKISMNPRGMDFWVGSWVDGTPGAQLFNYDGVAWNNIGGPAVSKTTNSVTISFPFANLGKAFGDTVDFDVYTTGGNVDPAVDALSNPAMAVSSWADFYTNNNVSTYTLQVVTAVPHSVSFVVDMGVPIWEYDNAIGNGFLTNSDILYVRGSFNGWGTTSADQLYQIGASTIFSNTISFLATPGDAIQYKFEGFSFPGYETTILAGGGNRTLTLTNTTITAPFAFFGDRSLTNPASSTVNFSVDMSVAKNFGMFDESTNWVVLRGSFNDWGNSQPALQLAQGAPPNTNIYSGTITGYAYYPIGAQNVGFYKAYITNLVNGARDNGWEGPISSGGGNRSFGIASAVQNLSFTYNDENPAINASIQQLNPSDVKVSFNSFPSRGGGYPTGGVYAVESRTSFTAPWTTNAIIHSTADTTSITNTGVLPGNPEQYYRVGLIGL